MQLRILAETVQTAMAFDETAAFEADFENRWDAAALGRRNRMLQTFPLAMDLVPQISRPYTSFLEEDIFERFVVACAVYSHAFSIDIGLLLAVHYIAEIVKITVAIHESMGSRQSLLGENSDPDSEQMKNIPQMGLFLALTTGKKEISDRRLDGMYHLLQRFILPFLRKAVLFTHVFEGVHFPASGIDDGPECDRLCRLLGIPTLAEVIASAYQPGCRWLSELIRKWVDWRQPSHHAPLRIHHPTIFEIIGLPDRLDFLLELASKFRCQNCNTVPNEPAMCLLCGEIVCAQAVCCEEDGMGEVNVHRDS
jgi:E3 ubiquitin-protein ligase UBR1